MQRIPLFAIVTIALMTVTAPARPKASSGTTVIAELRVDEDHPDPARRVRVLLIGGWSPRHGWLSSEDLAGVLPRGARLSLYRWGRGAVGEVQLVAGETDLSKGEGEVGSATGIGFQGKVVRTGARPGEESPQWALLGWRSPGALPLRWVPVRSLDLTDTTCRRVVSNWLLHKKVSKDIINQVALNDAVAADINGDGREEMFLAFHTPLHTYGALADSFPTRVAFSYLIMRYLPPGSPQPKIKVLADASSLWHSVDGFCDMNGDGWAEVIAEASGVDYAATEIFHWNGHRFERMDGWSWGA